MSDAREKVELVQRTRDRNSSVWVALDWGGLLDPLQDQQSVLDVLGRGSIENYLAITDEDFNIKEYQRDKTYELDQSEITQERQIANDKVALGRQELAIKIATDDYILTVRVYDAKAKSLIMGAREFAAEVEREQLAVEKSRAQLDVTKEAIHFKDVKTKIVLEQINKAQVEADLARAQVDVGKANVRALMADIQAGEAVVQIIDAQVQVKMAEVEKVTLQADVANILVEILVKKLAEIKLDVGQKEIQAMFGHIQTRLTDMLALWDTRTLVEQIKTEAEEQLLKEVGLNLEAEETAEDLKVAAAENAQEVLDYEIAETDSNIASETALKAGQVVARNAMSDARLFHATSRENAATATTQALSGARIQTYAKSVVSRWVHTDSQETIVSN